MMMMMMIIIFINHLKTLYSHISQVCASAILSLPMVGDLKAGGCDGSSWKKIRTKIS